MVPATQSPQAAAYPIPMAVLPYDAGRADRRSPLMRASVLCGLLGFGVTAAIAIVWWWVESYAEARQTAPESVLDASRRLYLFLPLLQAMLAGGGLALLVVARTCDRDRSRRRCALALLANFIPIIAAAGELSFAQSRPNQVLSRWVACSSEL